MQIFTMAKVIIENSAFFLGDKMFSSLIGPVSDKYLNHYSYKFDQKSVIDGQNESETLILDFRNTEDPYITDGYADFRFSGELTSPWH